MTMLIIGALVGGLVWLLTLLRPKPRGAVLKTTDDDSDATQQILISQKPRRLWLVALMFALVAAFLVSSFVYKIQKASPIGAPTSTEMELQMQINMLRDKEQVLKASSDPKDQQLLRDLQDQIGFLENLKEKQPETPSSPSASPQHAATGYTLGLVYFVVMLAGMSAEYMFGLKDFKKFTLAEFVRPFWVALIVFSVPWSLVDKSTLTFGSALACYQNGFFWKKVLERSRKP